MSVELHYGDCGPYFINMGSQDSEERPPPSSPSEAQSQYVHHLGHTSPDPLPPPDITDTVPSHKVRREKCIKYIICTVISLLLLLLVAGVLLGYYLSSRCVHGVACGDGSCVWESEWCDGVRDCAGGQDEASCLRVYGSSFLLQIYSLETKSWRPVCSHGWTDTQGEDSCRHIGYSRDTYFKSGQRVTNASDGFLLVKAGSSSGSPILQQLKYRKTCPKNSVVTLRCIDCGSRGGSGRVTGGQAAARGSWPWQVSLWSGGSHSCGGSIISPYWIVTAAHCVSRNSDPAEWSVYAGIANTVHTIFTPAQSVSRIVAHEGYNRVTMKNDIALVKLSSPIDMTASSSVGAVCLPNAGLNITVPQTCWISGFGNTVNGDSSSQNLTEAEVSLMDSSVCNSSAAYSGRITQDMLCAGHMGGGVCSCQGDSGGPLVSEKAGIWWLLGDTSWGCAMKNKPGVYGNVTYFLDWIYHQMQKHQDQ